MQLPEPQNTTSAAIVKWYETKPQEHRPHLGASIIGHECPRYVWLTWRWARQPSFPGRVLRMFSTGNREEPRLLEELRGIGAEVWATDPQTGEQFEVKACNGHFGGHLDGVAKGVPESPKTPCVLEFKTHNDKSWRAVASKGVEVAKLQHYIQMQIYMHLMGLERALYMAVNKNDDDIYTEWVHAKSDVAEWWINKAQTLIDSPEPPAKAADSMDAFPCKLCNFKEHCHGEIAAQANCRTCCHSTPVEDGKWRCDSKQEELSHEDQLAGCALHLMIPALVTYATPVDGGEGWIQYKHNKMEVEFVNGKNDQSTKAVFSSKELEHSPAILMDNVSELKRVMDATVDPFADFKDDLDDVYAPTPATQAAKRAKVRASAKAMKS